MKWKIIFFSIGGVLFVWILQSLFLPPLRKYISLKKEFVKIENENKNLEDEITELRKEKKRIENDKSYLEYLIRKKLMMIKPGEKVYRIK